MKSNGRAGGGGGGGKKWGENWVQKLVFTIF